jgi:transposase
MQDRMEESVKEEKIHKRYSEEFKRQAVELLVHSGKTQAQIARDLGVSDYSLTLWRRKLLGKTEKVAGEAAAMNPQEMFEKIRQLQKENDYLKRQREILKKAMSILGEEPNPGMR